MGKLKVAVIGLGQIGNTYDLDPLRKDISTHVGAYLNNPDVELAGVSDISQEKIDIFKKIRGDYPAYLDYRKLLAEKEIDLLSICTREDTHLEIITDAIARGIKSIFCEKPLCTTIREAETIKRLVENNDLYFSINISRRWDHALVNVKNYIEHGGIGEVQGVQGTYVKGIYNTGAHLIDMLRMLFGEIASIKAIKNKMIHEADPTPDLLVCFEKFNAFINGLDFNYYYDFELKIFGARGAIAVTNSGHQFNLFTVKDHDLFSGFKRLYPDERHFGKGLQDLIKNAVDDTVESVLQNRKPRCTLDDGIAVMKNIAEVIKQCKG